jgi:hypothetical protein
VFDTVFDAQQIRIVTANLLKNIKKRKLQPADLIVSLATDLYFHQGIFSKQFGIPFFSRIKALK